ncbi:MAG: hypothetical protein NXI13_13430 [Proteobacteria bacterium]|nr:hypothetical protein [Pseudomonadota bacterium]
MTEPERDKKYWLEEPKNQNKVFYCLLVLCGLLAIPDVVKLFGVLFQTEGNFELKSLLKFYSIYGALCYVALIFIAKWLRPVLLRKEDYYD